MSTDFAILNENKVASLDAFEWHRVNSDVRWKSHDRSHVADDYDSKCNQNLHRVNGSVLRFVRTKGEVAIPTSVVAISKVEVLSASEAKAVCEPRVIQLLISPKFSFAVSSIAAFVAVLLFLTDSLVPLVSFVVGSIAFALVGAGIVVIERAIKNGLPE